MSNESELRPSIRMHALDVCRFERKKEDTRRTIISIAMLLFKRQGFDATTMEQIADEVDIARKTLYNHFPVKEAIVAGYAQRALSERWEELIRQAQGLPDTRSRMRAVLLGHWEWGQNELTAEILEKYCLYHIQALLLSCKAHSAMTGLADILAYIVRLGQGANEIRPDLPVELLTDHLDWDYTSAVMHCLADPEKYPIQEGIDRGISLLLDGAGCRAGGNNR